MKTKQVTSKSSGCVLKGATAKCYIAILKLRNARRASEEDRKEDVKRKHAELKTDADVKAADEYEIAAERKIAAAKYRAEARERARNYKWELERKASDASRKLFNKSRTAAERKVDELLLEAIDTQNEPKGNPEVYLRVLLDTLPQRLRQMDNNLQRIRIAPTGGKCKVRRICGIAVRNIWYRKERPSTVTTKKISVSDTQVVEQAAIRNRTGRALKA